MTLMPLACMLFGASSGLGGRLDVRSSTHLSYHTIDWREPKPSLIHSCTYLCASRTARQELSKGGERTSYNNLSTRRQRAHEQIHRYISQ